jgi:phosphatidate cytidylyltransferase
LTSGLTKYSNLTQRIITAFIGAAVIVAGIVLSEWAYFAIFFFICIMSLREFYALIELEGVVIQKTFSLLCGLVVFSLPFFVERGDVSYRCYFLLFPLLSITFIIKLYRKLERKPFTNIAFTFLGILYIVVPFALLHIAAFEKGVYNFEIIFGCLFILWATDTGAYFAGTFFGKRKLFERISPKKSWEGAIGGAVLAFVFAYVISVYFHSLEPWKWMGVALIIIVGGVYGDLVESLLKRSIEIKDSGNALPGHGGFLDRFDGLFISTPFVVAFLELV